MKLADILSGCQYEMVTESPLRHHFEQGQQEGEAAIDIASIAYDSRKVTKGTIFVAVRGEHRDGHDFIAEAIRKGATAVVYEKALSGEHLAEDDMPSFIRVSDSRRALACLSNNFYKRPSEDLSVIGVTGTNGKTTTTYLIKSILETWGKKVGLIGTIRYSIVDREFPALHTTPESVEFQGLLSEMASAECSHIVTEVSSHALEQRRVDYTRFVSVVFTNLTRDHLDFHGTMEKYYASKKHLFTELLADAGTAVINIDDAWGRRLLKDLTEGPHLQNRRVLPSIITYGIEREADITATDIRSSREGTTMFLRCGNRSCRMESPLIGMFNGYNILAAVSVGIALNVPMEAIAEGIRKLGAIKGRFEKVDAGQDFLCIVDYAHTPDALERLLLSARELIAGIGNRQTATHGRSPRIIIVFGCGGDRDRGKRPVMGEIATRLSDYVIITSDNPRSENPSEIIREITSGVHRENFRIIADRGDAIAAAIGEASADDIVLIAGKGHEDYQEIAGIRHEFSDREVAEKAIRNKMVKSERYMSL